MVSTGIELSDQALQATGRYYDLPYADASVFEAQELIGMWTGPGIVRDPGLWHLYATRWERGLPVLVPRTHNWVFRR